MVTGSGPGMAVICSFPTCCFFRPTIIPTIPGTAGTAITGIKNRITAKPNPEKTVSEHLVRLPERHRLFKTVILQKAVDSNARPPRSGALAPD